MKGFLLVIMCVLLIQTPALALRYSTGSVNNYGGTGNLFWDNAEAADFRSWMNGAGHTLFTAWQDGDVWGSDFRDQGNPNDMEPSGGSDRDQMYYYTGHGSCENPPVPGSGDWLITHGNVSSDTTRIGTQSFWGNGGGSLQFMLIDASCPMDLPEIGSEWFNPFGGLHIAVGNSGDINHDTQDSEDRGEDFGANLVGSFWHSKESVTQAWMDNGTIDVQSQVCAVSIANDATRDAAISRRDNEFLDSGMSKPSGNWFAWRWVCD